MQTVHSRDQVHAGGVYGVPGEVADVRIGFQMYMVQLQISYRNRSLPSYHPWGIVSSQTAHDACQERV